MSFSWKTFGFPIESTVDTFTPNREIGWSVHKAGFDVHHAWVLVPENGGVCVITEETQKGADAIAFRLAQPNAMYDGHDWWLSSLKRAPSAWLIRPRPNPGSNSVADALRRMSGKAEARQNTALPRDSSLDARFRYNTRTSGPFGRTGRITFG